MVIQSSFVHERLRDANGGGYWSGAFALPEIDTSGCLGASSTSEAPGENETLLRRAAAGDEDALAEFWQRHRKRLRQMVRLRLERRLQGRVDP